MRFQGLDAKQIVESRALHGSNQLSQLPLTPLWLKILKKFGEPLIVILLVALFIQIVLFFLHQSEWYESVGILIAVAIANGVASVSEAKQEKKAESLRRQTEETEKAKVIRDGKLLEIPVNEIVVGDIVFIQAGDKISADGVIRDGSVMVDQSVLNGETEEAAKRLVVSEHADYDIRNLLNECYVYRGTVVCSGEACFEVCKVGDRTLFGELALELQEETRATPLQVKLAKLARQITIFGFVGASSIVLCIILKTFFAEEPPADFYAWVRVCIQAVTVSVTIIVCAVPEGLPMLTSILMSLQSVKMAKDNVLVRKINGLETAGSLNLLFCDKTGTITEGRLSVLELMCGDMTKYQSLSSIPNPLLRDILIGIAANNGASITENNIIGGNSTDRALLSFLLQNHYAEKPDVKILNTYPFDSNQKYSGMTVACSDQPYTYYKGAPERVLEHCSGYLDSQGNVHRTIDVGAWKNYLDLQSARSMRLLAVAKTNRCDKMEDLFLVCLVSIRDNVRREAAAAVDEVRNAGIQVVMVTGDRKETAVAIAREAGLLKSDGEIVLTSADMEEKTDEELKRILPNLRVVSRALPSDKSRLVRIAQEMDLVVGMTGDGVNDSPALKKADVGFAMGSGTEVAKSAGDITILDDNFSSIEKAILYGRTMFKSIRKFLVFQLTVNIASVFICFLGPMFGVNAIMSVIQLLLVNLAMDTLAAIAFGSEPALFEFMKEKPIPRSAGIVSRSMFLKILLTGGYITVCCLAILFFPPVRDLFHNADVVYLRSALFATFMMAITWNGFNARTESVNLFHGIAKNNNFLWVMLSILIMQYLFVTYGGEILNVSGLTASSWGICVLLSLGVVPVDMLRKAVCRKQSKKTP